MGLREFKDWERLAVRVQLHATIVRRMRKATSKVDYVEALAH